MSFTIWPQVGRTVLDSNGNPIPVNGLVVGSLTNFYANLLASGEVLTYDPLNSGGSPSTLYNAGAVQAIDSDAILATLRGEYDQAQARTGADGSAGRSWRWDAESEATPSSDCLAPDPSVAGRWLPMPVDESAKSVAVTSYLATVLATKGGTAGDTITLSGKLAAIDGGFGQVLLRDANGDTPDSYRTFASAVPGLIFERLTEDGRLNASWYGCVADDSSDNTAAFNAFISACRTLGRRGLIRKGIYRFTGVIAYDGLIDIEGEGPTATILRAWGSGARLHIQTGVGIDTYGFTLRKLAIIAGNGCTVPLEVGSPAAPSNKGAGGLIECVDVSGATVACVKLSFSALLTLRNCVITSGNTTGDALWSAGVDNENTTLTVDACRLIRSRRGAYLQQFTSFVFTNNTQFEENYEEGLLLEKPNLSAVVVRHLLITGSYFERNNRGTGRSSGYASIRCASLGSGFPLNVAVDKCYFSNPDQSGNYAISLGGGTYRVYDNAFNGFLVGQLIADNTSACNVDCRAERVPSTEWNSSTGNNAVIEHTSLNGGERKWTKRGTTFYARPQRVLGTAPPSAGGWLAGDHVDNSAPEIGRPSGWDCITSGTPGVWVPSADVPIPPVGVGSLSASNRYDATDWEDGVYDTTGGSEVGFGVVEVFVVASQSVASQARHLLVNATLSQDGFYFRTAGTNGTCDWVIYDDNNIVQVTSGYTITAGDVGKVMVSVLLVDPFTGTIRQWVNGSEVGAGVAITGYSPSTSAGARIGSNLANTNAADNLHHLGALGFRFTAAPSDSDIEALFDEIKANIGVPPESLSWATVTTSHSVAGSAGGLVDVPPTLEDEVSTHDFAVTGTPTWRPAIYGFAY